MLENRWDQVAISQVTQSALEIKSIICNINSFLLSVQMILLTWFLWFCVFHFVVLLFFVLSFLVMYEVTLKRMDSSFWPQVFHCIQQFLLLCLDDTSNIIYQSLISGLNFSISLFISSSICHRILIATHVCIWDRFLFTDVLQILKGTIKVTFQFLFISEKRHAIGVQCSCNFNTISLFLHTDTCKVIKH